MSTKIYNTYYLKKNLFDTFLFLKEIQPNIIDISKESFCKYVANIYADYHDSCMLGYSEAVCEKYHISETSGLFEDFASGIDIFFYEKEKSVKRSDIDFTVDVCVYPLSSEETIIQFFINNNNIYNKVIKIMEEKNLPSYDYYNNVDQPEGVSDEEWDERGKIWDKLMPTGVPIQDSFSFLMVNYSIIYKELNFYINREAIEPYIKHPMDRAREIVKDEVLAQIVTEKLKTDIKMSSIIKASEILKSDPYYIDILNKQAKTVFEKIK